MLDSNCRGPHCMKSTYMLSSYKHFSYYKYSVCRSPYTISIAYIRSSYSTLAGECRI